MVTTVCNSKDTLRLKCTICLSVGDAIYIANQNDGI